MDGYNAFMLVATALVLMMTTPALALFYGGMTRSKSVLNMMMMSYVALGDRGHHLRRSGAGRWASAATARSSPTRSRRSWLDGVATGSYIFVMFQLTFAVITAALISGAVADRLKFSAWIVFLPLWAPLSYFPLAHMVFGCTEDSLICDRDRRPGLRGRNRRPHQRRYGRPGARLLLGKRLGFGKEPMQPHNLTLTMLGAGLLWFGWYGFNVGSIVFGGASAEEDAASSSTRPAGLANTTVATWPRCWAGC